MATKKTPTKKAVAKKAPAKKPTKPKAPAKPRAPRKPKAPKTTQEVVEIVTPAVIDAPPMVNVVSAEQQEESAVVDTANVYASADEIASGIDLSQVVDPTPVAADPLSGGVLHSDGVITVVDEPKQASTWARIKQWFKS